MCNMTNLMGEFGEVSGIKLNLEKCEGLWLGKEKWRQIGCTLFGIKWPETIRLLGIYIGHNNTLNKEMNWDKKINDTKDLLNSSKKRNLTLFGKVQIIKTMAVSKIVHVATLLPIPVGGVKQLNSIFFNFIWGKRDKIKRNTVIRAQKDGGLNMLDLDKLFKSFKAAWIGRISDKDNDTASWVQLPREYLYCGVHYKFMLDMNIDDSVELKELDELPSFYNEVIKSYYKLHVKSYNNFKENILRETIWGNKFISVNKGKKKIVPLFTNWIDSGIIKVRDLHFKNGILDENFIYKAVRKKQNIWIEITCLRSALRPYQQVIIECYNEQNLPANSSIKDIVSKEIHREKSKTIYKNMIKNDTKLENEPTNNFLLQLLPLTNIDSVEVYSNKICNEKENKLKEFNYKLLYGILPCNEN